MIRVTLYDLVNNVPDFLKSVIHASLIQKYCSRHKLTWAAGSGCVQTYGEPAFEPSTRTVGVTISVATNASFAVGHESILEIIKVFWIVPQLPETIRRCQVWFSLLSSTIMICPRCSLLEYGRLKSANAACNGTMRNKAEERCRIGVVANGC